MNSRVQLSEMLESLRQKKLSVADLVQRLNDRGAVQPSLHAVELKQLDEARDKKSIDPQVHRLLAAKLQQLQAAKAPAKPAAPPPKPAPAAAADATTMNPAPAADAGAADGPEVLDLGASEAIPAEKTQMAGAGGGDGATTFNPAASRTGPRTGGKSGPSTSSWERLAAVADVPDQDVRPGMMLKERFYLEKEVGRGGMGVVYKARDERKVEAQDKNPWVAVKILNDEFRKHPQALISLQREARKSQQLTHDNILRVYDFDKAGTIVYMTMEYVDGGTVKDFIKKVAAKGGVPFAEARPVIEGMARGLARAHRDNIVHSDFKPGNVMLTSDLVPKIFDLGIARAAKSGAGGHGETTVFDAGDLGALTPAYASLEMIRGEAPEMADDIYALGITAYECLTGKHPYNKKNAEEAMKTGLKPERIKGLTPRQWKTLERALAFERSRRLQSAEDLIEGMRPRTWRDYALPGISAALGLAIVAGILLGVVFPYMAKKRVEGMVQRFEQAQFADHGEAVQALGLMKPAESDDVLNKSSTQVQDYFFREASAKWSLEQKRYDYPSAATVLTALDTLYKGDSKRVSDFIEQVNNEKNQELVRLNDEFGQRKEANRLFEDQQDNVAEVLAIVRQIDPQHELLKDQGLVLKYGDAVRQAMQANNLDMADKRLATALKLYPGADSLRSLRSDLRATRDAQIARVRRQEMLEQVKKMTPDQARAKLAALIGDPKFTPEWQAEMDVVMIPLAKDASAEMNTLKGSLAQVYAAEAARQIDQKSFTAAQLVVESGLKLAAAAPALMREKERLDTALRSIEQERAAQEREAKVADLKRTLTTNATANNVKNAETALAELRKLMPANDPFLTIEAPKAIGESYLNLANREAGRGQYARAYQLASNGVKVAPGLEALQTAQRSFRLEASVEELKAGAGNPAAINGDQLKGAASVVKAEDPKRYQEISGDVLQRIQALVLSNPAAAGKAKSEWAKVLPENQPLAALVIPEAAVATAPSAIAKRPAARAGVDTCLPDMAGFGSKSRATCFDALPSGQGPRLVVVPGLGGGGPFAMTKYEITVGQFNEFCTATGKCSPSSANAELPRTGITHAQAVGFAQWMTETTGFSYRLPTEAEWLHAATAQGQGQGDDFNCVLMQGSNQVKGGAAIAVNVGRPNPWGLINAVGNASEWVDAPGGAHVRGGNFNVPLSRCNAEWRDSSGGDAAGVRLVREMKRS